MQDVLGTVSPHNTHTSGTGWMTDIPLCRVTEYEHHGITAQEHLAHVAVLIDCLGFLLPFARLRLLRPHLLDVRQNPVGSPE